MEKDKQAPVDIDVTDEKYKGPHTAVVVAGHGAIEHLIFGIVGLFATGTAAFFMPKKVAAFVQRGRELGKELKVVTLPPESKAFERATSQAKRTFGGFLRGIFGDEEIATVLRTEAEKASSPNKEWFNSVAADKQHGFGAALLSHTIGILPFVGKFVKSGLETGSERFGNAVTVGGLAGAIGYASGWGKALLIGGVHGNQGKRQFERAKTQIKSLQEDNADLNQINKELHAKYVHAATRLNTIERDSAARADASFMDAARSEAPAEASAMPQAASPTTSVQLDQHQHQGRLAQQELAVA